MKCKLDDEVVPIYKGFNFVKAIANMKLYGYDYMWYEECVIEYAGANVLILKHSALQSELVSELF